MSGNRHLYFHLMSREEQEGAIRRLANGGMGESTIAAACGFSVEQIRRVLGEANAK